VKSIQQDMKHIPFIALLLLISCSDDPEPTIENTFLDREWVLTAIDDLQVSCEKNFIEETWKFRTDGVWSIVDNCFTSGFTGFWDYNDNGNIRPQGTGGVYFIFIELKKKSVIIELYNVLDELIETRSFVRMTK
jgi:hypothetical protein